MQRLVKFTWFITTLLFLVVLLWEYSYLPQTVEVLGGAERETYGTLSRENFFYIVLAVFAFSNAMLFALRKLILMNIDQKEKRESAGKVSLKKDISDWLLGFAGSLNVFLILALIYIGFYNNPSGVNFSHYSPLVYGGPVLMLILVGILIYILLKKRDGNKD